MADIFDVIEKGDADQLEHLIQDSVKEDLRSVRDDMGRTPLILASRKGHLACVKKLLDSGCYNDLDEGDRLRQSAFVYSLFFFHWDCFQIISQVHCYNTLKYEKKLGPIIEEIQRGKFEQLKHSSVKSKIVKYLTKRKKAAFLFLLISYHCPLHLLRVYINGQEDMSLTYHIGTNVIMYATLVGNFEALEEFLLPVYEADLAACDDMGKSALIYAVYKGCVKSGRLLLDALSNSEDLKVSLDVAINESLVRGKNECLEILLKCFKDNFESIGRFRKLLHYVTKEGNLPFLKILLHMGTDASWSNELNETALMHAVIRDNFDCFECLLEHGVPLNAVDCDGQTALMHAVQWNRPKCVARLLEARANINYIDERNMTAISMASCQSDTNILEIFLNSPHVLENLHNNIEIQATEFQLAAKFCNIKALLLLMNNGIFRWSWMSNCREISPEVIAAAAVPSKTRPGLFFRQEEPMTLLKLAFYYRDEGTVRFLMANLYLSEYDRKYLASDDKFIENVKSAKSSDLRLLLHQFISQPWSLKTLSLLCISSVLETSMSEVDSISKKEASIRQLPLPEVMLNKLMFRSAVSEVCVDKWRSIGVVMTTGNVPKQVGLMSSASPIWKEQILPPRCQTNDCHSDAESYRKRFETMRLKGLYC